MVDKFWNETAYITRYVGTGLVNTIVGFIVIFSAMAFGFSPILSNVAGYAVGFILGFFLSKKFVFRSHGRFILESVRYLIVFVISFLFNLIALYVTLNYLQFNATTAQIIAAITYTAFMYVLTRFFVFNSVVKIR